MGHSISRAVLLAPAKINLYLDITGTAPDGYHLLETVMQAISLWDVLTVSHTPAPEPGIRVTCTRPGVPEDHRNLVHRAAVRFLEAGGIARYGRLHLHIDKRIPDRAGLGGGSADAAAVLAALDQFFPGSVGTDRLGELALSLGADVPFALAGGCALARGVGEQLTPLEGGLPPCRLVVAKPRAGIATPEAYGRYDRCPGVRHGDSRAMLAALAAGDLGQASRALFNVFEQVLPEDHRAETRRVQDAMRDHGASGALLSGSGSAVVGVFRREEEAAACREALAGTLEEVFFAEPVAHGPKILLED